jgi:hypothetical protein
MYFPSSIAHLELKEKPKEKKRKKDGDNKGKKITSEK